MSSSETTAYGPPNSFRSSASWYPSSGWPAILTSDDDDELTVIGGGPLSGGAISAILHGYNFSSLPTSNPNNRLFLGLAVDLWGRWEMQTEGNTIDYVKYEVGLYVNGSPIPNSDVLENEITSHPTFRPTLTGGWSGRLGGKGAYWGLTRAQLRSYLYSETPIEARYRIYAADIEGDGAWQIWIDRAHLTVFWDVIYPSRAEHRKAKRIEDRRALVVNDQPRTVQPVSDRRALVYMGDLRQLRLLPGAHRLIPGGS